MKRALIFVFSLFFSASIIAQITGSVVNIDKTPVSGATVSLLSSKDSSIAKLELTNTDGRFNFNSIKAGNYIISATHIGYTKLFIIWLY